MLKHIPKPDSEGLVVVVYGVVKDKDWWNVIGMTELALRYEQN